MRLSSVTGVLHNASGEANCYAGGRLKKQISSYFRALIAVSQNNLLVIGSWCLNGSFFDDRFFARASPAAADHARQLGRGDRDRLRRPGRSLPPAARSVVKP